MCGPLDDRAPHEDEIVHYLYFFWGAVGVPGLDYFPPPSPQTRIVHGTQKVWNYLIYTILVK